MLRHCCVGAVAGSVRPRVRDLQLEGLSILVLMYGLGWTFCLEGSWAMDGGGMVSYAGSYGRMIRPEAKCDVLRQEPSSELALGCDAEFRARARALKDRRHLH